MYMNKKITIRPEEHKDYKKIISLILRSFQEGTDYSDGTDIIALVEEIRDSKYYIPELSFVAELDNEVVGHFLFSHFPLSPTREGGHDDNQTSYSLGTFLLPRPLPIGPRPMGNGRGKRNVPKEKMNFKKEKRILSKYEGGLWMIKNVPEDLKYLPERAMKMWFEGEEHILPEKDLSRLRDYLVGEIKGEYC